MIAKYLAKFLFMSLTLFSLGYAENREFESITVLGDSLSDTGNYKILYMQNNPYYPNKVVAGSDINQLYIEHLSKMLLGKPTIPSELGGTNYSIINAAAVYDTDIDIKNQYRKLLSQNPITVNNLYLIWIGGNDYILSLTDNVLNVLNGNTNIEIAKVVGTIAQDLHARGANNIMVVNMFDMGRMAADGRAPVYLVNSIFTSLEEQSDQRFKEQFLEPIHAITLLGITQLINSKIQFQNSIPAESQSGVQFFDQFYQQLYSQLFNPFISNIIMQVMQVLTVNSYQLKEQLIQELLPINGAVIYADVLKLFSEVIEEPTRYGIDNVVLPQCSLLGDATQLNICRSDKLAYQNNKDQNFIWSDIVHPSPYMHLLYSHYFESIINAPLRVSAIARQLQSFQNVAHQYLFAEFLKLSLADHYQYPKVLLSIAGVTTKIGAPYNYRTKFDTSAMLHLGTIIPISQNAQVGALLSFSDNRVKPYHEFKYQQQTVLANVMFRQNLTAVSPNLWGLISLNFGRLTAKDLQRRIELGSNQRIEQANRVKVHNYGAELTLGYDLYWPEKQRILSPYLSYRWQKTTQGAIQEKGQRSTAMHFSKFNLYQSKIELGLNARFIKERAEYAVQTAVHISLGSSKKAVISSGLNGNPLYHRRILDFNAKPALLLGAQYTRQISKKAKLGFDFNSMIDKNKNVQHSYQANFTYKL